MTAARIAVYPVDVRGLFSSSALSVASSKSSYSGVAQPSAAVIGGPIGGRGRRGRARGTNPNPNSFAADDAKFMQQTAREHQAMQQLAEETGGVPYYDKNGIKDAVAQAMK